MIEILPIRSLADEDAPIFGSLNVILAKLQRSGISVGNGIVVTAPNFKLKSILEHYDFGQKQVFEQSLTLVKKEINAIPIPEILVAEVGRGKGYFVNGENIKSVKNLWPVLLAVWLDQIKNRLWNSGFYPGITENLDPQIVIFTKKIESFGNAYFDCFADDVVVSVKAGKPHPNDIKKLVETVKQVNKKLLLPYEYEWILDNGIKLVKILPSQPPTDIEVVASAINSGTADVVKVQKSAVKVFLDLSEGLIIEKQIDGIYISSEKIYDLDKPSESFENLVFKVVESAASFPDSPVFVKLADESEGLPAGRQGMGKVRGALRLLHQKSLLDPLTKVLDFARHKKNLTNVHIVVPFVRGVNELLKIKRELAVKKLTRKNSLQLWMEIAVPENIVNLEEYLVAGIDGVVLNLDELVSYFNGVDCTQDELVFYKSEVSGLLKFLEDGIRLLHKSKIPFIAYGGLTLNSKILEYLVEKGVYGIVVERFESHSAYDLLNQVERRMILRRSF